MKWEQLKLIFLGVMIGVWINNLFMVIILGYQFSTFLILTIFLLINLYLLYPRTDALVSKTEEVGK